MIAALVFMLATIAVPPAPTQYVTDTAHALTSSTQDAVENELRTFEAKNGDQVIVWIGNTTGSAPLEEWTAQAGHVWKIGHKHKDNGAILFLFMRDRKVRIEVGYGLEATLTDARSAHIIDDTILPAMRQGDVNAAVQKGVDGMLGAIDPAYAPVALNTSAPATSSDDGTGEGIAGLVIFIIFLLIIFAVIITIIRRGKKHGDWLDQFLISGSMGSASAWSRGSGFGGGGGGGFSGGGGNFGGGGASGGW
jgi:uncharacterized protein